MKAASIPKIEPRTEALTVSLTKNEKLFLLRKAAEAGMRPSAYARKLLLAGSGFKA